MSAFFLFYIFSCGQSM